MDPLDTAPKATPPSPIVVPTASAATPDRGGALAVAGDVGAAAFLRAFAGTRAVATPEDAPSENEPDGAGKAAVVTPEAELVTLVPAPGRPSADGSADPLWQGGEARSERAVLAPAPPPRRAAGAPQADRAASLSSGAPATLETPPSAGTGVTPSPLKPEVASPVPPSAEALPSGVGTPIEAEPTPPRAAASPVAEGRPVTQAQDLGQQLARAVAARTGERSVEVRLDPPHLGRVRIEFDFAGDTVRAVVSAAEPEALSLLKRGQAGLARELAELGFEGAELSFARDGDRRDEGRPVRSFSPFRLAGEPSTGDAPAPHRPRVHDGLIDLVL